MFPLFSETISLEREAVNKASPTVLGSKWVFPSHLHRGEIIGSQWHARHLCDCQIWVPSLKFAEWALGLVGYHLGYAMPLEGQFWWLGSYLKDPVWCSIPCCSAVGEALQADGWIHPLCCEACRTHEGLQIKEDRRVVSIDCLVRQRRERREASPKCFVLTWTKICSVD